MFTTLAATYYDLVANYDRIKASISNLMAQCHMVNKNVLRARALVLERIRRHVKTELGTSTETYGNEKGDKDKVDGKSMHLGCAFTTQLEHVELSDVTPNL
jgi:hypothetical protein